MLVRILVHPRAHVQHKQNRDHHWGQKRLGGSYFSVLNSLSIFCIRSLIISVLHYFFLHFYYKWTSGALMPAILFTIFIQAVCECVPNALFDAITWLGYCNSTMNPIIYPLFMRDFKRALGRLLPCCSSRSTRRPSPALSLSLRNSGEPNLASSPPSPLASDPTHPPATATDAVNLLDAEHAGIELPLLLPNQVDTLDWNKASKYVLSGFIWWESDSRQALRLTETNIRWILYGHRKKCLWTQFSKFYLEL